MDIPEYRLDGKVALITGAGRGIGKGIAEVLAQAGADVIINSLTATHVTPLAAELARSTGRKIVPLVADVTRAADVERAVAQVLRDFGKLDILVNNLGDSIRGPLVSLTDNDLRFVMDVNLTATILCTRAAGPHMLSRGSGKVINVASFASHRGGAGLSIYTTAKTALVGFTRAMALEWAPRGVQVNAVAPGYFPDAVTAGEAGYAERVDSAKTTVPLGRVGRLREVGLLCLYLAAPASDYMIGQTLYLDGGVTL